MRGAGFGLARLRVKRQGEGFGVSRFTVEGLEGWGCGLERLRFEAQRLGLKLLCLGSASWLDGCVQDMQVPNQTSDVPLLLRPVVA